jgi:hypothetical protein
MKTDKTLMAGKIDVVVAGRLLEAEYVLYTPHRYSTVEHLDILGAWEKNGVRLGEDELDALDFDLAVEVERALGLT